MASAATLVRGCWSGSQAAARCWVNGPQQLEDPVAAPLAPARTLGQGLQQIICQTGVVIDQVNEPIGIVLPCGETYDSSHDVRNGIRFYNSEGLLVKRFATQDSEGTWSLSPTGEGPTVDLRVNANWWTVLAVPGDLSTGALTERGSEVTISSPGFGVILHIAGLNLPEGDHRGVFRIIEDAQPQVAAELCAALTA